MSVAGRSYLTFKQSGPSGTSSQREISFWDFHSKVSRQRSFARLIDGVLGHLAIFSIASNGIDG